MKKLLFSFFAVCTIALLSGCAGAAFNRVNMNMHRNISFGQELIDLKTAHEEGVINDTEYANAKKSILNLTQQLGEIEVN